MNSSARNILGLTVALTACYGAAAMGGIFSAQGVGDWYQALAKPSWTPPAWIFGPVWTVLYGMMAMAAWLIWKRCDQKIGTVPISLFLFQLALNAIWSPLFFGLHRVDIALIDIVLLWVVVAATVWVFLRRDLTAGLLLIPYLLWITFATGLNFAIWRLNW